MAVILSTLSTSDDNAGKTGMVYQDVYKLFPTRPVLLSVFFTSAKLNLLHDSTRHSSSRMPVQVNTGLKELEVVLIVIAAIAVLEERL